MANYTAADVKRLRDLTGAGMLDSKNALVDADGDFDKAVELLRIKGAKDVGKRAERATAEGLVAAKDGALIGPFSLFHLLSLFVMVYAAFMLATAPNVSLTHERAAA